MTKNSEASPTHKIEQSCLFGLQSKRKLYEILLTKKETVDQILKAGDKCYKEKIVQKFVRDKIKDRTCQIPKKYGSLDKIHSRIAKILSSIETKEYLFSCKKGKSYIDNAKYHLENSNNLVVKLDIKNYFPSITFEHIFQFFRKDLFCSEDISNILTLLVTYKGHLPTGCKMSMHIAYFSQMRLFDKIHEISLKNKCIMSLWVDDIVISGKKSKVVASNAKVLIRRHGLEYHDGKKFKVYSPRYRKEITGVILKANRELKLRNYSQKLIHTLSTKENPSEKDQIKLAGCLNEAKSIDKKYISKKALIN
jgi:hypothetical protein